MRLLLLRLQACLKNSAIDKRFEMLDVGIPTLSVRSEGFSWGLSSLPRTSA